MAIQLINIGITANDGTGDDLREAFVKVNNNFEELDLRDYERSTAVNLGDSGEGLFAQLVGYELQFKKIIAGTDVTLESNNESVTINANGGLKKLTVNPDTGTIVLEEIATLNVQGGQDIVTSVVGDALRINYTGWRELSNDTTPQLGGDLDGQGNNLLNIGNVDATNVTGSFTGNLTGLVHSIDIRDINLWFNNYWDFGVLGVNYSNVVQWLSSELDIDFGTFPHPEYRTIEGGTL